MDKWLTSSVGIYAHIFIMFLTGLLSEHLGDTATANSSASCTFEDGLCGWKQDDDDDFDWTIHHGDTPTPQTGPSGDHTKGSGYYLYVNAYKEDNRGKIAKLTSPMFEPGHYCLSFWYHMHGDHIHKLEVYTKTLYNKTTLDFSENGRQSSKWKKALIEVNYTTDFKFVVEAGVRNNFHHKKGDIAIDDFSVTSPCPLDCTFDDGSCLWRDDVSGEDTLNWSIKEYSNNRPSNSNGSYLEMFKTDQYGKAILKSCKQEPGLQCMSFEFCVTGKHGRANNKLEVFVQSENKDELIFSSSKKCKIKKPEKARVEINSTVSYRVLLVGDVTKGTKQNVHIDNIQSRAGHCQTRADHDVGADTHVCSEDWTGRYCNETATTTETSSISGSESMTQLLYTVTISAGAGILLIFVTAIVLLVSRRITLMRNSTREIKKEYDKVNSQTATDTGVDEPLYDHADADDTTVSPEQHCLNLENDYSEAHYMDSTNEIPVSKEHDNVYNQLNQTKADRSIVLDNTYSHITNTRSGARPVDKHELDTRLNPSDKEQMNYTNNTIEEEGSYDMLQTTNTKPSQLASALEDEYDHIGENNRMPSNGI